MSKPLEQAYDFEVLHLPRLEETAVNTLIESEITLPMNSFNRLIMQIWGWMMEQYLPSGTPPTTVKCMTALSTKSHDGEDIPRLSDVDCIGYHDVTVRTYAAAPDTHPTVIESGNRNGWWRFPIEIASSKLYWMLQGFQCTTVNYVEARLFIKYVQVSKEKWFDVFETFKG